jgi:hypothetical protein
MALATTDNSSFSSAFASAIDSINGTIGGPVAGIPPLTIGAGVVAGGAVLAWMGGFIDSMVALLIGGAGIAYLVWWYFFSGA